MVSHIFFLINKIHDVNWDAQGELDGMTLKLTFTKTIGGPLIVGQLFRCHNEYGLMWTLVVSS